MGDLVERLAAFRPTRVAVEQRPERQAVLDSLYRALYAYHDSVKTTVPLRETLLRLNAPDRPGETLGHYLVGSFTRSAGPDDSFGADVATFWWNRNFRVFRDLQRIAGSADERVVFVVGAGHVRLLRRLVEASAGHELVEAERYPGR